MNTRVTKSAATRAGGDLYAAHVARSGEARRTGGRFVNLLATRASRTASVEVATMDGDDLAPPPGVLRQHSAVG